MIRSVVFEEGEVFIAQCLDHDFAAQGKTPEAALERLAMTLRSNRESAERRGVPAFSNVTQAPSYYWKMAGITKLDIKTAKLTGGVSEPTCRASSCKCFCHVTREPQGDCCGR